MTFVNAWLLNNPQFQVIRCETVERRCQKSGEFDPDKTSYHTPSGGAANFVIILRYEPKQIYHFYHPQMFSLVCFCAGGGWLSYRSREGRVQQLYITAQTSDLYPTPLHLMVDTESPKVGKRAVHILLECFLV